MSVDRSCGQENNWRPGLPGLNFARKLLTLPLSLGLIGCGESIYPDWVKVKTECQGDEVSMGEVRNRIRVLGYYNNPRGTEIEAFDNASCGPEAKYLNLSDTVRPCYEFITWRRVVDGVETETTLNLWDGRSLIRTFQEKHCPEKIEKPTSK